MDIEQLLLMSRFGEIEVKVSSGLEAVRLLAGVGDYQKLHEIRTSKDFPESVQASASANFELAAKNRIAISVLKGWYSAIWEMKFCKFLSEEIHILAGSSLLSAAENAFISASTSGDTSQLIEMCNHNFIAPVNLKAGLRALELLGDTGFIKDETHSLPREVALENKIHMINCYAAEGSWSIVLDIGVQGNIPVLRQKADAIISSAVIRGIEKIKGNGSYTCFLSLLDTVTKGKMISRDGSWLPSSPVFTYTFSKALKKAVEGKREEVAAAVIDYLTQVFVIEQALSLLNDEKLSKATRTKAEAAVIERLTKDAIRDNTPGSAHHLEYLLNTTLPKMPERVRGEVKRKFGEHVRASMSNPLAGDGVLGSPRLPNLPGGTPSQGSTKLMR